MNIILTGPMGIGKTTFAKEYAKNNDFKFIDYDHIGEDKAAAINSLPTGNHIIDGITGPVLKKLIKPYKRWALVTTPEIVLRRYEGRKYRALEYQSEQISLVLQQQIDKADEVIVLMSKEEIKEGIRKFPMKYQYIEFPYGLNNDGARGCIDTWNRIKHLEWEGKTVCDLGCYAGYFCFELEKAGAKPTGIDMPGIINQAQNFGFMKGSKVKFVGKDLDIHPVHINYDVILLLNTLHHLRSPLFTLWNIFQKGKMVILETELPKKSMDIQVGDWIQLSQKGRGHWYMFSKEALIKIAEENGHILTEEIPSSRPNRAILVFKK